MISFRAFNPGVAVMALLAAASLASQAQAGSATSWIPNIHASTRLIADTTPWKNQKKALVAGIHIKLDEGWKTYWRYPGDSGLPPRFDWTGSRNLKSARLLWPAPKRLRDSAGSSIGYKNEVVFPVLIEPVTAGQPIELKLKLEFAVCLDICIPAEAELALKVGKDGFFASSYASLLSRYLDLVPGKKASGTRAGPSVSLAEARLTGAAPQLIVEARFPDGIKGADLFIEAPEGFYLASAERDGDPIEGTIRYKVDLTKGDDPKELKGKTLTLTLVSSAARAETTWDIE